jgi:hypothetical protein
MLGNYRVAAQLVASHVVLSSTDLVSVWNRTPTQTVGHLAPFCFGVSAVPVWPLRRSRRRVLIFRHRVTKGENSFLTHISELFVLNV